MNKLSDADCPLCRGPARYRPLAGESRYEFFCSTCSTYHITAQAREQLAREGAWDVVLSVIAATPGIGHTLVVMVDKGKVVGRPVKTGSLPN